VRDRLLGTTTQLTKAWSEYEEVDGHSFTFPGNAISDDGRYVAFRSYATNLVEAGTNGKAQIFLHDTQTDTTRVISTHGDGSEGDRDSSAGRVSGDGRYAIFNTGDYDLVPPGDGSGHGVILHDMAAGTNSRVSIADDEAEPNDGCRYGDISYTGRYVAFESTATNLVSGDTNGVYDIFVRDRVLGTTTRVSVASDGTQANGESSFASISADGRFVSFHSDATNLVAGDTNSLRDVFVHDMNTSDTWRVSVSSVGAQADGISDTAQLSPDGGAVIFDSVATNLVSDDTNGYKDVFVHHWGTGITTRVSTSTAGDEGDDDSQFGSLTDGGGIAVFQSWATTILAGYGGEWFPDIFAVVGDPLAVRWPREEAALPRSPLSALHGVARWLLAPLYPAWGA
jgi:hypothetical protein